MGRNLLLVLIALLITGCGSRVTGSASSSSPTSTFTPVSQPFRLFTHCGILTTYIARRTFYLAELYPARVSVEGNPGNPEISGSMTMPSPHLSRFSDSSGKPIVVVDQL